MLRGPGFRPDRTGLETRPHIHCMRDSFVFVRTALQSRPMSV